MSRGPAFFRTLPGDARIYIAHTERGERICLAVRDGVAVTVFEPRVAEAMYLRTPAVQPQRSGAQDEGLVASLLADRSGERREQAMSARLRRREVG